MSGRPARSAWTKATLFVLLANAGFLLLALWAAWLPRARLEQRVRDAFASGELIDDDWPWLDSHRGFNQYLDCSILQMISNRDDHRWAGAVGPLIYNANRGETDRCALLRGLVAGGKAAAPHPVPAYSYRYTRYWHGYNPVSAALLWLFDLNKVRVLLKTTGFLAFVLLLLAAGARQPALTGVAAAVAVTGVLFWGLPYFGQSLSQAPGDIFLVLGIACLLFRREQLSRLGALIPFCAVYGAGAVYFEFFTGQIPTAAALLLPFAYLIARLRPDGDSAPAAAWRFALAGTLAFVLGGGLTILVKQMLAVAIVGPDAARVFLEYLHRYVNPSPAASLQHFGETWSSPRDPLLRSTVNAVRAVLGDGYILTYGSRTGAITLYLAGLLGWLAAGAAAFLRPARPRSDLLAFVAGACVVLLWTCAFQTHATLHKFWMVRMVMPPLSFGWGALAWQLLPSRVASSAKPAWAAEREDQLL